MIRYQDISVLTITRHHVLIQYEFAGVLDEYAEIQIISYPWTLYIMLFKNEEKHNIAMNTYWSSCLREEQAIIDQRLRESR